MVFRDGYKSVKRNVLLMVISLIVFTACAVLPIRTSSEVLEQKLGDGGLISGSPCAAPCFMGMVPEETSQSEVLEILSQRGISEYCQFDNTVLCENSIYIKFNQDNIVSVINFTPSIPVTVESVFQKYGEPNSIDVFNNQLTPEAPEMQAGLLFDGQRMYISLSYQNDFFSYIVNEEVVVARVFYLNENEYSDFKASDHVTNWNGYGEYVDPDSGK